MPNSYMGFNQSNSLLETGLVYDDVAVLNTIVNKNIIVVQYVVAGDYDPYAADKLISCKTKYSLNFGQDWTEIELNLGSFTWYNLGVDSVDRFGKNGCTAEFIIRNSSGTKFLLYTPIYHVTALVSDYMTITPRRETRVLGWLVHDEKGQLVNSSLTGIMKEHQPGADTQFYDWMKFSFNPTTTQITNYKETDRWVGEPFYGYPIASNSDAQYAGSYDAQRVVNKTDTVDYVSNGKRYTIVKRYYNLYVRRGDILEGVGEEFNTPGVIQNYVSVGYFVFTVPFIYVFDHSNFNSGTPSLQWVDVLDLTTRLAKLKDHLRPTQHIHEFIKSLISEDSKFHEDVFYARSRVNVGDAFAVQPQAERYSIRFESMIHGELMKVHDQEDDKDLLGLIFGNRRFVCTSDPTVKSNWILGEVKNHHRHPTEKAAVFYRRQLPNFAAGPRLTPGNLFADGPYGFYGIYYLKYDAFCQIHQNLRIDNAGDRVVAFPDRNYAQAGELTYRFAYFIKDPTTGRYSIGIRSKGVDVGYNALTGSPYQSGAPYPVVINRAVGVSFNMDSFIAKEPLNAYVNPFVLADPDLPPSPSFSYDGGNSDIGPNDVANYVDQDSHNLSFYCLGTDKIGRYTHVPSGLTYDMVYQSFSADCGYGSSGAVSAKPFKLRLIKNLNNAISGSRQYFALIDGVLTSDKRIILRPKLADIAKWGFKITNNTITVTFLKPTEFGLTAGTVTHTLTLDIENIITTTGSWLPSSNPTDWRAATCEADVYETVGDTGSPHFYNFNITVSSGDALVRVENGPIEQPISNVVIGTQSYPYTEQGASVPYTAILGVTSIGIS